MHTAQPDIGAIIDQWIADSFHGSIVARDADTYNHVYQACLKLKELLKRSG